MIVFPIFMLQAMLINNKSFFVKVVIEESRKGMVELQDYYPILYNAHCNSINVYRKSLNILSIESLDWKRSHRHSEGEQI